MLYRLLECGGGTGSFGSGKPTPLVGRNDRRWELSNTEEALLQNGVPSQASGTPETEPPSHVRNGSKADTSLWPEWVESGH